METIYARGSSHVQSKKENVKVSSQGKIEQSTLITDYSVFFEIVKRTNNRHCYMLGVNSRDKKKLNEIIVHLLGKNMLTNVFNGLDSSKLFISSLRLRALQKEIDQNFKGLKFILVTLNRAGFPKQRYC